MASLSGVGARKRKIDIVSPIVVIGALIIVIYLFSLAPTPLTDWHFFYEAPLSNPYAREGFMNPYWLKWIISPLDLLPFRLSFSVFLVATIGFVIYIFNGNKWLIIASLASPYFLHIMINGQVEVIVLLGYWLIKQDNPYGIPFMLTKPQVMIGSAISWFVHTSRSNKVMSACITAVLIGIGFAIYGDWITEMIDNISPVYGAGWNIAFNLPLIGIVIFLIGLWRNNLFISGLGTLFITPYVAMHSLWVYWTAWLMENPNKKFVFILFIVNWMVAIYFT